MSCIRRPYFVIPGLPDDDETLQEFEVEQVFHIKPQQVRVQLEAMQQFLKGNGFGFDGRLSRDSKF